MANQAAAFAPQVQFDDLALLSDANHSWSLAFVWTCSCCTVHSCPLPLIDGFRSSRIVPPPPK
eukprot:5987503-Amphidinium_carterae.1